MDADPLDGLIELPEGTFEMGNEEDAYPADGEGPVREVTLSGFAISATAVTNAEFAEFVGATGHRTTAEVEGWSFVFAGLLPDDFPPTRGVLGAEWWRQVEGADWRHPEGPDSRLTANGDRWHHPVVHVSWFDAVGFAAWADGRLPTEAQWEYAARGGLDQKRLPWGDETTPNGRQQCNIFTGTFPVEDTAEDGWAGTCPVDEYEPNGYGLYNCSGNVWEWCADWFTAHHSDEAPLLDPSGPPMGLDREAKGGSYLSHDSCCHRYRVGARLGLLPDSTLGHHGFRLAR